MDSLNTSTCDIRSQSLSTSMETVLNMPSTTNESEYLCVPQSNYPRRNSFPSLKPKRATDVVERKAKEIIDFVKMTHCDPKSFANLYQPQDEIADSFSRLAHEIVTAKGFTSKDFKTHDLHLSEAYVLLWQNAETGDVDGRRFGLPLKIGAFAAMFIDLIAEGKLEMYMEHGDPDPLVRLVDDLPTDTFLDVALFDHIRNRNKMHPGRSLRLPKWLERQEETECVDIVLENLCLRGILRKESTGPLGIKIFKKFPTLNAEPEKKLEQMIRAAAFVQEPPDSYLLALISLCREADSIFMGTDPILRKHFSSVEYNDAKRNMDEIVLSYLKK